MPFHYLDYGYFLGGSKEARESFQNLLKFSLKLYFSSKMARRGRRDRDRMVVGFTSTTTTYVIVAYHH